MRIACPNCGAQYEVDDALIPETGRDVQCSNCGKGWFQPRHPAVAEADAAAEVGTEAETETVAETVTETVEETVIEAAGEPVAGEVTVTEDGAVTPPEADERPARRAEAAPEIDEDDEGPGPDVELPRPARDESVMAVLREEAAREMAQRRAEAAGLESQPDLGLGEAPERRAAAAAAAATAVAAGRRDLLPDIDVINSTLRSDIERAPAAESDEMVVEDRRRGFRLGFGLVMLAVAALIGLYVGAAWLAQTVPALEPYLAAYVAWANGVRAWFDGLLAAGVEGLSGLTPPASET